MVFSEIALQLVAIEQVSSRLAITEKLAHIWKSLAPPECAQLAYLLQGRVRPEYEGIEFAVAEKQVIKGIALAYGVESAHIQAHARAHGDLGATAEYYRTSASGLFHTYTTDATIREVYDTLLTMSHISGQGSQERKLQCYADILSRVDALSARYITRMILDTMRLGFSDTTILDSLSWALCGDKTLRPAIEQVYQRHPDIGMIMQVGMSSGMDGLKGIAMELHVPVIMMRAQRLSSGQEIIEELGDCDIEPKYDGLRLQVHVDTIQKRVSIFTRGLEHVTATYPDIVHNILECCTASSCVLEGEAVGIGSQGELLDFQHTVTRKRKHNVAAQAQSIPLRFFLFDILMHNGVDCTTQPFHMRRALLESVITTHALCTCTPLRRMSDPHEIEASFEQYTAAGLEGIMAKKRSAPYIPGARDYGWVKLKRSYTTSVQDTIDCVIMGYDSGKGKRADFGIGAILVGVYDKKKDMYYTLAKIGTGLSDEQWRMVRAACEPLQSVSMPSSYVVQKQVVPDIWVEPQIVLEIRCDSISISQMHTAGYSMRFPRLERWRDDKQSTDTTTIEEIAQLASVRPNI